MKKEERIARQRRQARAVQVREAQRRRRARLKSENQRFLQIIVPDDLRELIFAYGNSHGLTLQEAAVVLVQQGLGLKWEMPATREAQELDSLEPAESVPDFEDSFAGPEDIELASSANHFPEEEFPEEEPEFMHPAPVLEEIEIEPEEAVALAPEPVAAIEIIEATQEPEIAIQEEKLEEEPEKPKPPVVERRRPLSDDGQMSFF